METSTVGTYCLPSIMSNNNNKQSGRYVSLTISSLLAIVIDIKSYTSFIRIQITVKILYAKSVYAVKVCQWPWLL